MFLPAPGAIGAGGRPTAVGAGDSPAGFSPHFTRTAFELLICNALRHCIGFDRAFERESIVTPDLRNLPIKPPNRAAPEQSPPSIEELPIPSRTRQTTPLRAGTLTLRDLAGDGRCILTVESRRLEIARLLAGDTTQCDFSFGGQLDHRHCNCGRRKGIRLSQPSRPLRSSYRARLAN